MIFIFFTLLIFTTQALTPNKHFNKVTDYFKDRVNRLNQFKSRLYLDGNPPKCDTKSRLYLDGNPPDNC